MTIYIPSLPTHLSFNGRVLCDLLHRKELDTLGKCIKRGVASVDSVLVKGELDNALDEFDLLTAHGIAA